ncbi:ankyrin repeat domain-containing protein [Kordiimonas gwangyangensis]|uniref:ankyrin repeat domain-containing protein n=1 Tax=Kordiimonas gwangyangensis TaxID=288022 RepID=UPI0012DE593C
MRSRKTKAVEVLLEAGADPNVQDLTGKTALEYAKLDRNRRLVKALEDAGATY